MSLLKEKVEIAVEETELAAQKSFNRLSGPVKWFLIITLLGTLPVYYLSRAISQSVWSARYAKNAVAAKPSFTNPKDITVSAVSLTALGTGSYAAVVQITNENLELSTDNLPFVFNFYNADKQLMYSYSDTTFLLPDQKKYIIVPKFSSTDKIVYTEFKFSQEPVWQKRLNLPQAQILTPTPSAYTQDSPQAFVLEGYLYNKSPYELKQVRLNFLLYDAAGKIIGVSRRDEFTIAPYERRGYKQLWPGVSAPTLAKTEVYADTDTLDSENLSVPAEQSDSAAKLNR